MLNWNSNVLELNAILGKRNIWYSEPNKIQRIYKDLVVAFIIKLKAAGEGTVQGIGSVDKRLYITISLV